MIKENREMAKGRDNDQVMGRGTPGETEGGRRPTGVSPGEIGVGPLGQGQRWTAARKREALVQLQDQQTTGIRGYPATCKVGDNLLGEKAFKAELIMADCVQKGIQPEKLFV